MAKWKGKNHFLIYTFCFKEEFLSDKSQYKKQYMIGEVNRDAEKYRGKDPIPAAKARIREELSPKNGVNELQGDTTDPLDKIEDLKVFSIETTLTKGVDQHFHKFLQDKGFIRFTGINGSSTEIFNITREDLDRMETAWETNDPDCMRGDAFTKIPRKYQKIIIEEALQKYTNKKKILLYVATRAGKSFISLQIAKKLKAKRILIVTPFPTAETSFKEEAQKSKNFEGYEYLRLNASTELNELDPNKNYVFFVSWQYLNPDKDNCKIFQKLFDIDFLIIDEIHNTSDSSRSSSLLDFIPMAKNCKQLWMSGTPFEDILSGKFTKENTVMFSLFTFIKYSLNEESQEHPEIFLPHLHIRTIDNFTQIYDKLSGLAPEVFPLGEKISMIEAFHTHGMYCLFNSVEKAETYFRYLLGTPISNSIIKKPNENNNRFFTGKNNIQKAIIAYVSSNEEVENVTEALNNLKKDRYFRSPLHEYQIIKVSGNNNIDQLKSDEASVNNFIKKANGKAIIVSCDKLTTGVTIPALDTIWLFKNTSSLEKFSQIIARPLGEYKYEDGSIKRDVNIYAFDSTSCLKATSKLINFEHKTNDTFKNKSYKEMVEDTLDYLNFELVNDDLSFSKIPAFEFLESLKEIEEKEFDSIDIESCFKNLDFLEDTFDLGLKKDELIKNTNKTISEEHDVGNRELITPSSKKENASRKINSNAKLQFLTALKSIDRVIIEKNIKTISQLKEIGCPEILLSYKDTFENAINNNIKKVRELIDTLNTLKNFGNLFKLSQILYKKSSEDASTPKVLLDKMTKDIQTSKNTIICDPCMGSGAILTYAYQYLNIPKDHLYGFDIDEENIRMMKALGFKNVYLYESDDPKKTGAQNPKCWKGILDKIKKEVNIKNMKFDYIIMNPPYERDLHLKILDCIKAYTENLISLQPMTWLKKCSVNRPMSKWKENFKNYFNTIDIISHEEANKIFNTGNAIEELAIYSHFIGNKNYIDLEYFGFSSLEEHSLYKKINIFNIPGLITFHKCADSIYGCIKSDKTISRFRKNFDCPVYLWHGGKTCKEALLSYKENPTMVLYFNSEAEKQNFIKSLDTHFMNWYYYNFVVPGDCRHKNYMFRMDSYESEWTDERFYKFFDLTADEIKIIEDTMEKYK